MAENKITTDAWEKRILAALCGIAVVLMLCATLWPFHPFPRNRVRWVGEGNGLRFGGPGIVVSQGPLQATGGTGEGNSCSLELLLRPASVKLSSTMLTFSVPGSPQQFAVRQWLDNLLVTRDAPIGKNQWKRTKIDVDHVFQVDKLALLTMTSGPNGTAVYLNGRHVQTFPKFVISASDLSGQLVMGTSSVDYQPWPGEIDGLAIYNGELTAAEVAQDYENWVNGSGGGPDLRGAFVRYSFAERSGAVAHNSVAPGTNLEIPAHFQIPHKAFLKPFWREFEVSKPYFLDALMNVAGFMPLGFIFAVHFLLTRTRGRAILYATLIGGGLSLLIEVLQAYIPRRASGTSDIITNTAGALLGALLARPELVRGILRRILPGSWVGGLGEG